MEDPINERVPVERHVANEIRRSDRKHEHRSRDRDEGEAPAAVSLSPASVRNVMADLEALGLIYAQTHPERVRNLILRGIFLLTERELRWFYQDGASMMFPDAWARFCAPIPEAERGDFIEAYRRRLTGDDHAVKLEAARAKK